MEKVLLITGNGRRHRYAANLIAKNLNLCGAVFETKASVTGNQATDPNREEKIIQKHFRQRDEAEIKHLGELVTASTKITTLEVEHGASNSTPVFEWVQKQNPDLLLLYGSSIIKPPLLDYYDGKIINMHLGLSPYYRGSGTNFWPLVEGLPECVGVTIHIATSKVDAGSIITQVRPQSISTDDNAHDIGTKTIIAGLTKMCEIVPRFMSKQIELFSQDLSEGKLFKRKDFTADAVLKLWENLENGMIEKYLNHKKNRDSKFPIIEQ